MSEQILREKIIQKIYDGFLSNHIVLDPSEYGEMADTIIVAVRETLPQEIVPISSDEPLSDVKEIVSYAEGRNSYRDDVLTLLSAKREK